VDSVFADVFLGVMIIRGENLALLGESVDDGPLISAPIDVVLRRISEEREHQEKGVSVDLGFLDTI